MFSNFIFKQFPGNCLSLSEVVVYIYAVLAVKQHSGSDIVGFLSSQFGFNDCKRPFESQRGSRAKYELAVATTLFSEWIAPSIISSKPG